MKLCLYPISSLLCLLALMSLCNNASAQSAGIHLDAGLRIQKTINLYSESGINIHLSKKEILNNRLFLNFAYVTSRIGSAWHSNAIVQDNYLISAGWLFRPEKTVQPILRLTSGWFHCDYGNDLFDNLPESSALFCFEPAVRFKLPYTCIAETGLGYHFITGNGSSVPGTLYPLFLQFSISYSFLENRNNSSK